MFNRRLLQAGISEPPLPTMETVLWKGYALKAFTITIPPGVKVLKITTDSLPANNFFYTDLPTYIGVTGGKTYNICWAYVKEGNVPEPEYWSVEVYRGNIYWVDLYGGEDLEGASIMGIQIIMSYSASINGVTPNVLDY